jgi:hypothetical protein
MDVAMRTMSCHLSGKKTHSEKNFFRNKIPLGSRFHETVSDENLLTLVNSDLIWPNLSFIKSIPECKFQLSDLLKVK